VTRSLYNCYVYFLVSVLRAVEVLENCYIVFCKLLASVSIVSMKTGCIT
jgi:hypothetical protein